MSDLDDSMDELRTLFFTECAELLADMESRLLTLDAGRPDSEQLNAIFRAAHSIKGGSGAFGLTAIAEFTHALEALLDAMREMRVAAAREVVDALLKSADMLTRMLDAERDGAPLPADFASAMVMTIKQFASGQAGAATATSSAANSATIYHLTFVPPADCFTMGHEPLSIIRGLQALGELSVVADVSGLPEVAMFEPMQCYLRWDMTLTSAASEEQVAALFEFMPEAVNIRVEVPPPVVVATNAAPAEAGETAAKPGQTSSIRVDLEKVDRLVNMVGELVITEAMLRDQVRHLPSDRFADLLRGIDELSHHTRELQEAVMAVRMQPVKSIFSRMPRIVRDTAAQLKKDIQLVLSGENTEVDKTVIESLADPLTHMIRNSVDHGIETPDQRVWNDKPAHGTINLSAYHRSGRILIEIADDGAGIDRERVLNKAREKGLVAAETTLSDAEIDHLIFLPGFSTAETVTNVSGRGVGMDVVRRNIEALNGTVSVLNQPGKGSTFTVSLPLTLAILDGMIVRVGAESYIIPITSIIETLRPRREEVHSVEGRSNVINVRGEFVPLLYLSRIFHIRDAEQDASRALVVLVEAASGKIGLVVDELIGQQQVVIKSLEANADPVRGISGATILGDGKVSLILEINELKALGERPAPMLAQAA